MFQQSNDVMYPCNQCEYKALAKDDVKRHIITSKRFAQVKRWGEMTVVTNITLTGPEGCQDLVSLSLSLSLIIKVNSRQGWLEWVSDWRTWSVSLQYLRQMRTTLYIYHSNVLFRPLTLIALTSIYYIGTRQKVDCPLLTWSSVTRRFYLACTLHYRPHYYY